MGVPKFFRWLCERWPCIYETVDNGELPPTDNLYIDVNGILHVAANQAGGQGEMAAVIERAHEYIDRLVMLVKPQCLLYLATDGVAPRAKLEEQRARRFRASENMKLAKAAAARRGEALKAFDTNAVSPGTQFMNEVTSNLKFYVRRKISENGAWQVPKVIISGSDVPGEGEQKILEYIHSMRASGKWPANITHCVYGLDANIVMLALASHEPHMFLLRELVSYGKGSRGPAAREMLESSLEDEFVLCRMGLLRDYLELEIQSVAPSTFPIDVDRIVEDFILLCILTGNTWLAGLPTFDMAEGVLDRAMDAYKQLLPVMGGYVVEGGNINSFKLEQLLHKIARMEAELLSQRVKNSEYFEAKRFGSDMSLISEEMAPILMHRAAREIFELSSSSEEAMAMWQDRHYMEKLQVFDPADKRLVVEEYARALNWSVHYYTKGVASWTYSYPYLYAPFAADMKKLKIVTSSFDVGNPLTPFTQLMATLPRFSYTLLPEVLQPFMEDPESPLGEYYPDEARIDMEGKRAEWEAIVLLPGIDYEKLVNLVGGIPSGEYSDQELDRNKLGHALSFVYREGLIRVHLCDEPGSLFAEGEPTAEVEAAPDSTSAVKENSQAVARLASKPSPKGFSPLGNSGGMIELPPGFPTLKTLEVEGFLMKIGVRLFTYPSEKESLLLTVISKDELVETDAGKVSKTLLGRQVFVDWPYLRKATVMKVENREVVVSLDTGLTKLKEAEEINTWENTVEAVLGVMRRRKAVDVDDCKILVTVKPIEGWMRTGRGTVEERFGDDEIWPLQVVLRHCPIPTMSPARPGLSQLRLKPGDKLLYVGKPYQGCVASVLEEQPDQEKDFKEPDKINVLVQPHSPASLLAWKSVQKLMMKSEEEFHPSGAVAQLLSVSPQGLSRITGSLWVNTGTDREEVGLAVKLGSKNMCVPGYVRPSPNGTGWEYTDSLVSILETYKRTFYWVFKAVDCTPEGGEIRLPSVFPYLEKSDIDDMVQKTKEWLATLPLAGRPLVKADCLVANVHAIKRAQAILRLTSRTPRPVTISVKREDLIPPVEDSKLLSENVGGTFDIGDLVSYVGTGKVPFGVTGLVAGVMSDGIEVLFANEVFESSSVFGTATSHCSCLVQPWEMVNMSALTGEKVTPEEDDEEPPANKETSAKGASLKKSAMGKKWSAQMEFAGAQAASPKSKGLVNMESVSPKRNGKVVRLNKGKNGRRAAGYQDTRIPQKETMAKGLHITVPSIDTMSHNRTESVASERSWGGQSLGGAPSDTQSQTYGQSYGSGVYIPGLSPRSMGVSSSTPALHEDPPLVNTHSGHLLPESRTPTRSPKPGMSPRPSRSPGPARSPKPSRSPKPTRSSSRQSNYSGQGGAPSPRGSPNPMVQYGVPQASPRSGYMYPHPPPPGGSGAYPYPPISPRSYPPPVIIPGANPYSPQVSPRQQYGPSANVPPGSPYHIPVLSPRNGRGHHYGVPAGTPDGGAYASPFIPSTPPSHGMPYGGYAPYHRPY